jgi:hypothetical protein
MIIDITILLIIVSFVLSLFRSQKEFKEQRIIAIDKGVPPFEFTLFNITTTLYWIPILIYYVFRLPVLKSFWFPFVVILTYLPGILLSETISTKLECGYDFQRKAAKKIKEVEFLGWIGLAYFELIWIVVYTLL